MNFLRYVIFTHKAYQKICVLVDAPFNKSLFKNAIPASTILKCLNACNIMIIMQILQKKKENLVCVLSPHASITKKKEKSSVCFEPPCEYYN